MHAKLVLAHKLDHKLVVNRSLKGGTRAAIVSVLSLAVLKTTRFLFDRSVCHVFFSIIEEEGFRCFLGISKEATEEAVSRLVEEGTLMVAFRWGSHGLLFLPKARESFNSVRLQTRCLDLRMSPASAWSCSWTRTIEDAPGQRICRTNSARSPAKTWWHVPRSTCPPRRHRKAFHENPLLDYQGECCVGEVELFERWEMFLNVKFSGLCFLSTWK